MTLATQSLTTVIARRSAIALLALGVIACNGSEKGGLKVAGGTIDGSTGSTLYPATMYVVMEGIDFDDKPRTISNVGTFVDVGLSDKVALILSLKDIFVNVNGRASLPIFKKVNITIYPSSDNPISINNVSFQQDGSLKQENPGADGKTHSFALLSVGLKVEKVEKGKESSIPEDKAAAVIDKVFFEDPLKVEDSAKKISVNLRDPHSSYQMMLFPRSVHSYFDTLTVPKLIVAEKRGPESGLKDLKLVGFGENVVGGDRKREFALASNLPSIRKRNYAAIKALNTGANDQTPFHAITSLNSKAAEQVWEVFGSGLCGTKDSSNYDTGAAVYTGEKEKQFLGFAVASTARSNYYKGKLDCAATDRSDMASVIVSPSAAAVEKLLQLEGSVK